SGKIHVAQFSPDGSSVITNGRDRTRIWATKDGRELFALAPSTMAVFSPDGRRILTKDDAGNGRIFEWQAGKQAILLRTEPDTVAAYPMMESFSPDGRRFVHASSNGIVKILDL